MPPRKLDEGKYCGDSLPYEVLALLFVLDVGVVVGSEDFEKCESRHDCLLGIELSFVLGFLDATREESESSAKSLNQRTVCVVRE